MAAFVLAPHSLSPATRLKDAAAVAFIALLLGIPMIGLTTVDSGGALQIATRWPTAVGAPAARCSPGSPGQPSAWH